MLEGCRVVGGGMTQAEEAAMSEGRLDIAEVVAMGEGRPSLEVVRRRVEGGDVAAPRSSGGRFVLLGIGHM